jgi:hypothetical protein
MSENTRRKNVLFIYGNNGYSREPIELREEEANNWIAAGLARETRQLDHQQSYNVANCSPNPVMIYLT